MTFQRIELTPTISTGAYAAADVVGGLITVDQARLRGGGLLNQIVVVDDANQKVALDLWFFNAAPTSIADNAAFSLAIADLKKVITKVPVVANDYVTNNSNGIAVITDINNVVVSAASTVYLYVVTATGSTPTYGATDALFIALDFVPEPRGKW